MQSSETESTDTKLLRWFARLPEIPTWFLWPFYFLIMYVLSTGPAARLINSNSVPPGIMPAIECFYAPVQWLSSNSELGNDAIRWYVDDVWGFE